MGCRWSAAPAVPRAEFQWIYGTAKHPGDEEMTLYEPLDLNGQYVAIERTQDGLAENVWYGVCEGEVFTPHGAVDGVATGIQTIFAYGLEHLLDRISITSARVRFAAGQVNTIGWTPVFNARPNAGPQLGGNRSADPQTAGVYVFSDDASSGEPCWWTNLDIAQYLLKLMKDAALRKKMGEAGRKRSVERYDYRVVAKDCLKILSEKLEVS